MTYNYIGIDVAKDKFDIAFKKNDKYLHKVFARDDVGLKKFIDWIKMTIDNPWCCMEATGHYSEEIGKVLSTANIPCSIINPMQIKNYARSKLLRNKNDILDARVILDFAYVNTLCKFEPRSENHEEVRGLSKLLSTLKSQVGQLKNKLESMHGERARRHLGETIKELEDKIAKVEEELNEVIKNDRNLIEQFQLITSIPGLGKIIGYTILERVPDIKQFKTAKQFAAFIGVSPKQNQSGRLAGKTTISKIGDRRLRAVLYMGALVAKRYNPTLKKFVESLTSNGKSPKTIVCAVMRKLAHFIFGVLKNNRAFDRDFTVQNV